jgi:hypothetical protein
MYSLPSIPLPDTDKRPEPKLPLVDSTILDEVVATENVRSYSCVHECCSQLVVPAAIEEPIDMVASSDTLSDDRNPRSPLAKIEYLIRRMTLMGHTAMTFCMAGIGGFVFQITQAHCLECWATRLLPCALIAGFSGLVCRGFDKKRAELIDEAKEIQSLPADPFLRAEPGVDHDQE